MRFLVYAVYALVAGGADAFSAAGSVATGLSARSRSGIITLHASQHPSAARRVMLAGASLAGLAQLAAPKAAMAIDFRKMITGEEEGKERASVRLKKEAESNGGGTCDVYECYTVSDDKNSNLVRVQLGGVSVMAPSAGNRQKFEPVEGTGLLAAWKDGSGAFIEVKTQPVEEFGFEIIPADKLPPAPLGASALKLNVAGVGALVAKARATKTGQKHTYVNGRARLAEQQSAVVYVLGVRNEDDPQIILVGTSQRDGAHYTVSCGAPTKDFKAYKDAFSEIVASLRFE